MKNMEDEKFLLELGYKMNAQDNRMTQFPLFVIQHTVRVPSYFHEMEYDDCERKEDIEDEDLCESCRKLRSEGDEIPDNCENCDSECYNYWKNEEQFDLEAGVFLTAEACEDHIKLNHYHYNNPKSYAIGAWRNPEMQNLLRILSKNANADNNPRSCYN